MIRTVRSGSIAAAPSLSPVGLDAAPGAAPAPRPRAGRAGAPRLRARARPASAASRPRCRRCRSGRSGRGARTGRSGPGPRAAASGEVGRLLLADRHRALGEDARRERLAASSARQAWIASRAPRRPRASGLGRSGSSPRRRGDARPRPARPPSRSASGDLASTRPSSRPSAALPALAAGRGRAARSASAADAGQRRAAAVGEARARRPRPRRRALHPQLARRRPPASDDAAPGEGQRAAPRRPRRPRAAIACRAASSSAGWMPKRAASSALLLGQGDLGVDLLAVRQAAVRPWKAGP